MKSRKALWITAASMFVLDQALKSWAMLSLKPDGWQPGDPSPHYPFIDGLVRGTWALGSMQASEGAGAMTYLSPIIGGLFWSGIFVFVAVSHGRRHVLTQIGAALLVAALFSNLLDMLLFGGVRNFLLLDFDNPLWQMSGQNGGGMFAQRPNFSTAAIALWLGMLTLLFGAAAEQRRRKTKPLPPPPPPPRPRTDSTRPYGYREDS